MMRKAGEQCGGKLHLDPEDAIYVVARELVISCPEKRMPAWQRHLFAFMSRNVVPGSHYLGTPPDHPLVYTWLLRL